MRRFQKYFMEYTKNVNLLPICIIIYVKKAENLIKFVLLFENTYDII